MTPFYITDCVGAAVPSLIFERILDACFVETFSSVTNSTAFLVVCRLFLLGGSSSASVIFAELDASLLS